MGSELYTSHFLLKEYILKKTRNGYYEFKLTDNKTYAKGYYYNDQKIGFWEFYDRKELYTIKNRKIKIDRLCKLNIKICQLCVYGKELPIELNAAFYDENNNNHCLKWLNSKTYNDDECCVPIECPYYLEQIALREENL